MPKKSKRSRQAKLQRATGITVFGSTLTDDDPFQKLLDPDYNPLDEEIADDIDSDGGIDDGSYAFSMARKERQYSDQKDDDWGSSREDDELDDELIDVASDESDESDSDLESDTSEEELEVMETRAAYQKIQLYTPEKAKLARTLNARGTYTGAAYSTMAAKRRLLREASVGSSKITSFFLSTPGVPAKRKADSDSIQPSGGSRSTECALPTVIPDPRIIAPLPSRLSQGMIFQSHLRHSSSTPSPSPSPVIPSSPAIHPVLRARLVNSRQNSIGPSPSPSPVPSVGSVPSAETRPVSPVVQSSNDPFEYTPSQLLSVVVDGEEENEQPSIGQVIEALIKDAKRHQTFTALFKLHAIQNYLELRERYRLIPQIRNPATRASLSVAHSVGRGPYFAKQIRRLTLYVHRFRTLPPTNSGKHHAHPSLLNDERISQAVRRYLTVVALGEITPQKLQHQVNQIIIPSIGLDLGGKSISERCARRWLHKLGYGVTEVKKGVYVDGHERPDVVAYRKKFLQMVNENDHLRYHYDDETLEPIAPTLKPGEKLHVPIHQDESIIRSNELRKRVWAKDGKLPLRKKGNGQSIHVSGFITEFHGQLRLTPEMIESQKDLPAAERIAEHSQEIIYPGKNSDGWWNAERLIEQVKRTIPIFEKLYPNAVAEFFFDQSTAHGAYAADALNANEMNVNPGGKQRRIHSTVIPDNNPNPELRGKPQSMIFDDNLLPSDPNYQHRGQPKGMKQILKERQLWDHLTEANGGKEVNGDCAKCKLSQKERERREREEALAMSGQDEEEETSEDALILEESPTGLKSTCCMRKVLSEQLDFRNEKPLLQVIIEAAGHKCYFLPKFHCELNPIEMYWGWLKYRFRCLADGSFKMAKRLVPELLDACPVKTIRAFYRKCWRYMDAYEKGLDARQAEFAVKLYRSHRKIGRGIMMRFEIISNR